MSPQQNVYGQAGEFTLQPVSGAEGVYETVTIEGQQVYRSFSKNRPYELYMYFRWADVFRRMDAYIPWNVGNDSGHNASTHYWAADKTEIEKAGVVYMPLVFPGLSWDNLKNQPPGTTNFPRRKGAVLWNQFVAAHRIGAQAVYVAMFDEIDDGTAIFKVTNDVPTNHYFLTLEGLPSDFYLRLTGLGTLLTARWQYSTACLILPLHLHDPFTILWPNRIGCCLL